MKAITISIAVLALMACNSSKLNKIETLQDTTLQDYSPLVGNDKDVHNCKGSAGYQWSILKNNCIRIFEDGISLIPKQKDLDKSLMAYIVFRTPEAEDSVELFLPTSKNGYLLLKDKNNQAGKWKNETYELQQWKGMYTLEKKSNKIVLFQGAVLK